MILPGYWMHETSGVLRPAIEAYLNGELMTIEQIGAMRAYLRQWIDSPYWHGLEIEALRISVGAIGSRAAITAWLNAAMDAGIDPL